jgi:hypothetical protein
MGFTTTMPLFAGISPTPNCRNSYRTSTNPFCAVERRCSLNSRRLFDTGPGEQGQRSCTLIQGLLETVVYFLDVRPFIYSIDAIKRHTLNGGDLTSNPQMREKVAKRRNGKIRCLNLFSNRRGFSIAKTHIKHSLNLIFAFATYTKLKSKSIETPS